jgi:type IV pilus assembly protein PilM
LNLGAAVSTLNIVARGISAFTREITNAGNSITEEIRKACNCSYEQAEAYKCGGGPTQIVPQEVHQVIQTACNGLAGEIQRSLDFYLATSGETEIQRIFVSGGTAYLAPLAQAVEKRARVPVQIFDPMVNLTVDPKAVNEPWLRAISAQMVVALGLGLRTDKERRQWSA